MVKSASLTLESAIMQRLQSAAQGAKLFLAVPRANEWRRNQMQRTPAAALWFDNEEQHRRVADLGRSVVMRTP